MWALVLLTFYRWQNGDIMRLNNLGFIECFPCFNPSTKFCTLIISYNHHRSSVRYTLLSSPHCKLESWKVRQRMLKNLAQSHTVSKWWSQNFRRLLVLSHFVGDTSSDAYSGQEDERMKWVPCVSWNAELYLPLLFIHRYMVQFSPNTMRKDKPKEPW